MTERIVTKNSITTITGKDQAEIDRKKIKIGILPAIEPVKKKSRKENGADSADIKAAQENIIHKED